jgi:hypothetical protein
MMMIDFERLFVRLRLLSPNLRVGEGDLLDSCEESDSLRAFGWGQMTRLVVVLLQC